MHDSAYFRSITKELNALRDRVRHFIHDRHWLSDGEWKESVVRAVLRRNLPKTFGVGSGFVVTEDGPSTQVDILIYDNTKPILFQDGDFVIVTSDLVHAIIEVKTRVTKADLLGCLEKLATLHSHAAKSALCQPFVGLFAYENQDCDYDDVLSALKETVGNIQRRNIHAICLGEDLFCRFWYCPPETPTRPNQLWRVYELKEMAPAYFVHNVIESLCARSIIDNSFLWYPKSGKEEHSRGEQLMERINSQT